MAAMPTFSFAESTIEQEYGISVVAKPRQIQILEDSIAVFPGRSSSYLISSATLISSIASSNGWAVSGWAATEGEAASTSSDVRGGYVILTKSGEEDVYIPVTTKGMILANEFGDSVSATREVVDGRNVTQSAEYGIGGKAADDVSYVLKAGDTAVGAAGGIKFTQKKLLYTYAFNVYADGSAAFKVFYDNNSEGNKTLFVWNADSTYQCYKDGTTVEFSGTMTRNRWHRMVFEYCISTGRYKIFADGKQFGTGNTNFGGSWGNDAKPGTLGMFFAMDKGSTDGRIAFDNLNAHYGLNDDTFDELTLSTVSEDIDIADGEISVNVSNITTAEDFMNLLTTNADRIALYTDETYSEEATVLGDKNILVLENVENSSYKYYTVGPAKVEVSAVDFVREGSLITATSSIKYSSSNSVPVTMIMVLKDSNGFIRKILSSDTELVSKTPVQMTLSDADSAEYKAEVFFINSWLDRKAIFYKIYSE